MSNQDYFTEFRKTFVATVREKLESHNKNTVSVHEQIKSIEKIFQYIYANTGNLFMYCMIDFVNAYTSQKTIDTFYNKAIEMHNASYKYDGETKYGDFRELCKNLVVVLKIMYKTLYNENIEQKFPEKLAEIEDILEKQKAKLRRSPRIAAKNNNNNNIEPVALRRSARLAAKNR
jgi:hypothetical protein